jgi:hypothetical protein
MVGLENLVTRNTVLAIVVIMEYATMENANVSKDGLVQDASFTNVQTSAI